MLKKILILLTLLSDSPILNRSERRNETRQYTSFYGLTTNVGIGAMGVPAY